MKPTNLHTKIFLDSGDPKDTKTALELLGFLDGQTTNPSLIAKNPEAQARLAAGNKFSKDEVYVFYKKIVTEISDLIPTGSVSIEVYAGKETPVEPMFAQAKEMFTWIPNAHIKLPITKAGLAVAEMAIQEKMRVNLTLCFNQEQAGAVYASTKGAVKGQVFVSPFIGRLDDIKLNGMDLIKNISQMFSSSDGHTENLAASIRSLDHFLACIAYGADIITAPLTILQEWADKGMPVPDQTYQYDTKDMEPIAYQELDINQPWKNFALYHSLTDRGLAKFSADWNTMIAD
ncbi:MAG: transaldolase [Candidatus Harrisonbacteria bacterium CG10_big_fil_rev_8_21_14_0_10_45_28]|uniref:Transaldolase n=1 Tax=Candidatus Harrisonbacteria bacterium CG10_big_fil_rev_8_21_14_0_10_45_28 TaxID=1974586 RepID=A0A2H0UQY0_9BACT|nr:MAG: transaldolase [Candidatus Harrisonbacteria bacterium CG10_big_fil_rev_8_21_14_0_10_45_28]